MVTYRVIKQFADKPISQLMHLFLNRNAVYSVFGDDGDDLHEELEGQRDE